MRGYIGEIEHLDKKYIYIFFLASIVAGTLSVIGGMGWLYILAFIGALSLCILLVYRYHWVQILSILLLSVVVFEPAPTDILFLPLLMFGIIGGLLDIKRLKHFKYIVLMAGLFAIINTLQLLFIHDVGVGIKYYFITLYLMGFCLYVSMYVSRYNIKDILKAYIISSTLSAILGISGYIGFFSSILMYDKYRIMAFFKDPNVLGPFLVPTVLILIDDMWERQIIRHSRWTHISLIIINLLGIIATFSRGAWVNLIIGVSIYCAFTIKKIKFKELDLKRILTYVVVIVIIMSLVWSFVISGGYKNFIYGRMSLQAYDKGRFAVQEKGIMLAFVNYMGYGPGQFEYNVIKQTGVYFSAHNLYIRVLVENGLAGFIAFMGSLGLILYKLILDFKQGRTYFVVTPICLIAILSGIMINSLVIDTLHWRHFWFFLGLGMANFVLKEGERHGNKRIEQLE